MKSINNYIESGLLEFYVLGAGTKEQNKQIHQLAAQYPAISKEIDEISLALQFYAMFNFIKPTAASKKKLMARIRIETAKKAVN